MRTTLTSVLLPLKLLPRLLLAPFRRNDRDEETLLVELTDTDAAAEYARRQLLADLERPSLSRDGTTSDGELGRPIAASEFREWDEAANHDRYRFRATAFRAAVATRFTSVRAGEGLSTPLSVSG